MKSIGQHKLFHFVKVKIEKNSSVFVKYQTLIKLFAWAGIYLNCIFENQSYKFFPDKCLIDMNLPLGRKQLMTRVFRLTEKDAQLSYFSVSL